MSMSFDVGETENRLGDAIAWAIDCLRRRWRLFLALVVLVCVAGTAWVMMLDPKYEAVARLRLDPARDPMINSIQEKQASLNPEAIETEVKILRSTELAWYVAKQLKLRLNPKYVADLPDHLSETELEMAIVAKLRENLKVNRDELTYIIEVKYSSGDRREAARIANAFVDAYFDRKLSSSTGTAARQAEFFRVQLKDIGSDARKAEAEVASYRSAAGITSNPAGHTTSVVVDEQIGPLSAQIATAESAAAAAGATYSAALQQQETAGIDSISEVRSSPVVTDLRKTRADILRNIGEIDTRYGEKHPETIRAREQLAVVDGQLKAEAQRILSAMRSDSLAAQARVNTLRSKMDSLDLQRRAAARASVIADSLESEASAKRAAYDRMSQMSLTSSQAARNPMVQAEIVDRARVSSQPVSPNRPMLLALVLLASLATGTGGVALRESLTSGMRTAHDIETKLGLPLLAAIPEVPSDKLTPEFLLNPSASRFFEALRMAKTAISGGGVAEVPKVIAFPSALPGEGKSTTALAFASVMAVSRHKVLVVECDVRRAALRPLLQLEGEAPGLVEILSGEADIDEAICPSGAPDLDLLLVRSPHFSAADLFGNTAMEKLLDGVKARYDVIVLDLPPLLGLADAQALTVLANTNVLVVQWEQTPVKAVTSAAASLRRNGAALAGVIYTRADGSAEVVGGSYYSGKYAAYYEPTD